MGGFACPSVQVYLFPLVFGFLHWCVVVSILSLVCVPKGVCPSLVAICGRSVFVSFCFCQGLLFSIRVGAS